MKKILLTIIAGIGGFGALLADDGRSIVITKTDAGWGGTPHICLEEGMTDEMLENTPMPFSPRFYATMELEGNVELYRGCGYKATFGAPILEKTEEETLPSVGERICTRIEGCGVDLNAETEEEYCPTCVWKVDDNKDEEVVSETPTHSNRRKKRTYQMFVCEHWNPVNSVEPEPVCRVVSSN